MDTLHAGPGPLGSTSGLKMCGLLYSSPTASETTVPSLWHWSVRSEELPAVPQGSDSQIQYGVYIPSHF